MSDEALAFVEGRATRRINILNCARCGKDHAALLFVRFIGEPIEDTDGTVWNWWSHCPEHMEPILMKLTFPADV